MCYRPPVFSIVVSLFMSEWIEISDAPIDETVTKSHSL